VKTLLVLPWILGLSSCCTIAEYFCGPDKSRWVSKSFATHEAALTTFMEAVRRDNTEEIYNCLSERFKDTYGIPGMLEAALAWEEIKKQVPGIHLLGTASVGEPRTSPADRVTYRLERAGHVVEVVWIRLPYWEVVYESGSGKRTELGAFVPNLARNLKVSQLENGQYLCEVDVRADILEDGITSDRIQRAGVGREWKIFDLRSIQAE
jgi:hypothetical protein